VDFHGLREALRRHRAARGFTLDAAADASGVNRHTIHRIENIKREPEMQPELDTIEKLVRAYGLTLSSFFAEIEHGQRGHESGKARGGGSLIDLPVRPVPAEAVPGMYEELGRLVVRLAHDAAGEQAPIARPTRSPGRKGDRKNR
jgi:transcriptional regulator with XRE-family HTH domain